MAGFYSLYELYTTRETEHQKPHKGIFPWSQMTIRRMWGKGEFPQPVKLLKRNVWRVDVIDKFVELIAAGMEPADATIQAASVV